MNRFYCPDLDSGILDVAESRHAVQVMRLGEGSQAKAFNGKGSEVIVELTHCSSKRVEFKIVSQTETPQPTFTLSIGQAITKGKSMDLILQKLTELGVQEIYPLLSSHSVVRLDETKSDHKTEKWEQTIIEACKQSGQLWIPKIHPPCTPQDFCTSLPTSSLRLIASLQPETTSIRQSILRHVASGKKLDHVSFMVGPEGDFTREEIQEALASGFLPVTLGPNVLRSETAAIYTASVLLHELRENHESKPCNPLS